jgi:RNA polymerase sigma-70 factor (ECF subfamily)
MLHERAEAEDVVQGLFLDLLQRAPGMDPPAPATLDLPYLYRAITRRCLNRLRDEKNRARLLDQRGQALPSQARTSCEQRAIDQDLLLKLSFELPQSACEVLVYRFIDDMTQDEIAELTGLSRKTVGKRLDEVREAVRRLGAEAPIAPTGGEA